MADPEEYRERKDLAAAHVAPLLAAYKVLAHDEHGEDIHDQHVIDMIIDLLWLLCDWRPDEAVRVALNERGPVR